MARGKRINRHRRFSASWFRRRPERREEDGGGLDRRLLGVTAMLVLSAAASPRRRPRHPQLPVLCHPQSRLHPPPHLPHHLQDRS